MHLGITFQLFIIKKITEIHHGSFHYRPRTKLRKGNVFTPVCQSFCSQEWCLPQCMLENTPLGRHHPGQKNHLGRHPAPSRRPLQWAIRILLECFLVYSRFIFKGVNTPSVKRQDPIGMHADAWKPFLERHNVFQWDLDAPLDARCVHTLEMWGVKIRIVHKLGCKCQRHKCRCRIVWLLREIFSVLTVQNCVKEFHYSS